MFYNCHDIKSIDLSLFNNSFLENFDEMFLNCTSLEYLDISSFNLNSKDLSLFEGINKNSKIIVNNYTYITIKNSTKSNFFPNLTLK